MASGKIKTDEIIAAFEGIEYYDIKSYFLSGFSIDKIIYAKQIILENRFISKPRFKLQKLLRTCSP